MWTATDYHNLKPGDLVRLNQSIYCTLLKFSNGRMRVLVTDSPTHEFDYEQAFRVEDVAKTTVEVWR